MKRISAVAAAFSVMALVACGSDSDSSFSENAGRPQDASPYGSRNSGSATTGAASSSGSIATPAPAGAADDPNGDPGKVVNLPQAGQLTAGVWDDNLNFDFYKKYLSLAGDPASRGLPIFTVDERSSARLQLATPTAKTELDLTFVIDTTGSMGDELRYLQSEVDSIASSIAAKHPQMQPRFNLIVYRDHLDEYETKVFQWGSAAELKTSLDAQSVGGGGDYEEAVAAALTKTADLDWRTGGNVARLAFWVADAPHHIGEETQVHDAIVKATQKDVHLYPVAASGADDRTEFTMRTAAQMTGGRYVFLTNDSGIGNDHAEPHIPCYDVTRFDGAIVRMVESELSGKRIAPADAEIVRSVGNPTDGVCQISSGSVSIY
jgi:hypothetical protein